MKITKLTSIESREVMPTECERLLDQGQLIMGAIQMPMPDADSWPSAYDLQREAQGRFGAVKIADGEPDDDDTTVTWLVVPA